MEKKRKNRAGRPSRKFLTLLIALLVVISAAVSGTVAFLADSTAKKINTFEPSRVTTTVEEKFENGVKSDVKIQNTGDTTAWVRAAVVITWQDEKGNVYGQAPVAGTDYTIEWSETDWLEGNDGFYYWKTPVAPNAVTGELIKECTEIANKAPEGYSLTVEILGSSVQYQPEDAFQAWAPNSGITIAADGKSLEKVGAGA